jgi:uncharacterized FlaG/YvyC family protein
MEQEIKLNVYQKLQLVQAELVATKDLRNDFGKYNYRSAETILKAVKPLLGKYKLALTLSDSVEQVADRVYVKAIATLINIESPLEIISTQAYAREDEIKKGMDQAQITGASSSYARKYALNGLLAIDDNRDSDSTNQTKKGEYTAEQKVKNATPQEQREFLKKHLQEIIAVYESKGKEFNFAIDEETDANVKKLYDVATTKLNLQ